MPTFQGLVSWWSGWLAGNALQLEGVSVCCKPGVACVHWLLWGCLLALTEVLYSHSPSFQQTLNSTTPPFPFPTPLLLHPPQLSALPPVLLLAPVLPPPRLTAPLLPPTPHRPTTPAPAPQMGAIPPIEEVPGLENGARNGMEANLKVRRERESKRITQREREIQVERERKGERLT